MGGALHVSGGAFTVRNTNPNIELTSICAGVPHIDWNRTYGNSTRHGARIILRDDYTLNICTIAAGIIRINPGGSAGTICLGGQVRSGGTVFCSGGIQVQGSHNVQVQGNFAKQVYIHNDLGVSANLSVGGNLSIGGALVIAGNLNASTVQARKNLNVSNTASVGGNLSVKGSTYLSGNVTAKSDVSAAQNVFAGNNLNAANKVSAANYIHLKGQQIFGCRHFGRIAANGSILAASRKTNQQRTFSCSPQSSGKYNITFTQGSKPTCAGYSVVATAVCSGSDHIVTAVNISTQGFRIEGIDTGAIDGGGGSNLDNTAFSFSVFY